MKVTIYSHIMLGVILLFSSLILRSHASSPIVSEQGDAEWLESDHDSKADLGPSQIGAGKTKLNKKRTLIRRDNQWGEALELEGNGKLNPGAVALNVRARKTKMTAVIVSVHMGDILNATLPYNENHFNRIIVITSKEDTATQALCDGARSNITCRVTDAFYRGGDKFNKGRALNEVQQQLHQDSNVHGQAVLFMDPDILLPEDIWAQVPVELADSALYTVTMRCIYKTPEAAKEGVPSGIDRGCNTMGFFQLYKVTPEAPLYPTRFATADQSDLAFGNSFNHIVRLHGYANHLGPTGHWTGNANLSSVDWSRVKIPPDNWCPKASTFLLWC